MGACESNPEASKNNELNRELNQSRKVDENIKKLLFLGSGGSGKSTLYKQLRTIHGKGYTSDDRMFFVSHIHAQIIEQMKLAIEHVEFLQEEELIEKMGDAYERPDDFNPFKTLCDEEAQAAVSRMQSLGRSKLTEQVAADCKLLWSLPMIQDAYEQRAISKIDDTTNYFWDHIDDVTQPNYVPNESEMLMVRFRTTGVIDQKFTIEKTTFHVFDVGGQKSERKKWYETMQLCCFKFQHLKKE